MVPASLAGPTRSERGTLPRLRGRCGWSRGASPCLRPATCRLKSEPFISARIPLKQVTPLQTTSSLQPAPLHTNDRGCDFSQALVSAGYANVSNLCNFRSGSFRMFLWRRQRRCDKRPGRCSCIHAATTGINENQRHGRRIAGPPAGALIAANGSAKPRTVNSEPRTKKISPPVARRGDQFAAN